LLLLSGFFEKNTYYQFWIIDQRGKIVMNQRAIWSEENSTLNVRSLSSGEYVLIIEQNGQMKSVGRVKE
jgi:hypothetical protein